MRLVCLQATKSDITSFLWKKGVFAGGRRATRRCIGRSEKGKRDRPSRGITRIRQDGGEQEAGSDVTRRADPGVHDMKCLTLIIRLFMIRLTKRSKDPNLPRLPLPVRFTRTLMLGLFLKINPNTTSHNSPHTYSQVQICSDFTCYPNQPSLHREVKVSPNPNFKKKEKFLS